MRNNCFSYWKYHCTSVAMLNAPFLCQTGGSWFKKRIVINVQQNTSCGGKRQRCTSFYLSVCVWNTAVCRHAEKVSSYWVFSHRSGNDTRTVQWAIAAAVGTTAERRRPEATWKEIKVALKCSCRCSLVSIENIQFSERHLQRKKM